MHSLHGPATLLIYSVRLKNPKVGDEIIFLNAGAHNYTTDFFGYVKLETEIVEDF